MCVSLQRLHQATIDSVPHSNDSIVRSSENHGDVFGEVEELGTVDEGSVWQHQQGLCHESASVPHLHCHVRRGGQELLPIRRPTKIVDEPMVAWEGVYQMPCFRLEYLVCKVGNSAKGMTNEARNEQVATLIVKRSFSEQAAAKNLPVGENLHVKLPSGPQLSSCSVELGMAHWPCLFRNSVRLWASGAKLRIVKLERG